MKNCRAVAAGQAFGSPLTARCLTQIKMKPTIMSTTTKQLIAKQNLFRNQYVKDRISE